jgi:hypothetical protein
VELIDIIKWLVSVGLSPLEIGTAVVAIVLYVKAEKLDADLHDCLDATKAHAAQDRIDAIVRDKH